jgi:hypothetical protein
LDSIWQHCPGSALLASSTAGTLIKQKHRCYSQQGKKIMKRMALTLATLCLVMTFCTPTTYAAKFTGSLAESTFSIADTDKLYLTVVGPTEDAKYQELVSLFASQPKYAAVKDATHYHVLATDSAMYKSRYMQDYPAFPTVRVQTIDGAIVKEWSGDNVPANDQLVAELQCLPRWREKHPKQPTPAPVTPAPVAPVTPAPKPVDAPSYLHLWAGLAAMLMGLGFGVANEMHNS